MTMSGQDFNNKEKEGMELFLTESNPNTTAWCWLWLSSLRAEFQLFINTVYFVTDG